jgi:hypothetical protein
MLNPKLLTVAVLAASLTFGAAVSIGAAQEAANPAAQPNAGMMGSGMMGMGEMHRMMENCNRMMESMMQRMPSTPAAPSANSPEKKS